MRRLDSGARPAIGAGIFMTGNTLYKLCSSATDVQQATCVGYLVGGYDMFVMNAQRWKQSLCIPKDVSIGQVAEVVKKYLVVHPEERHFQAPVIVLLSLAEAWTCPK